MFVEALKKKINLQNKKGKGLFYGITSNIVILGITSLLTDVSGEMITAILPLFLTSLGASTVILGLVGGLSDAGISIFKVFSGYLSDKSGKRKQFIIFGYAFSSFSKFFIAIANSWPMILVFRPLERLGKGIRDPPRDALMAETTKKEVHGKVFGFHKALDNTGALIGSILALIFIGSLKLSFNSVILISSFIAFAGVIPLFWIKESPKKRREISLNVSIKKLSRKFRTFLSIVTLFALANFTYMFFILKALQTFDNYTTPIFLYILYNISYVAFAIPGGILSDRIGRKKILIIGYSLFALTCLGFALVSSTFFEFAALFIFYGIAHALIASNERAFAADLASKELGTALGTFYMAIGLASLPAGLIAGAFWQINPNAAFFYGAAVATLAAILFAADKTLDSN